MFEKGPGRFTKTVALHVKAYAGTCSPCGIRSTKVRDQSVDITTSRTSMLERLGRSDVSCSEPEACSMWLAIPSACIDVTCALPDLDTTGM